MTRYRSTLAYDGTAYLGFQRQAEDIPTIQSAVEHAIHHITGQTTSVVAAGRTDTGVHATHQVIAFDAEWRHGDAALQNALNATLPGDIAVCDLCQHPGFHPRFDARSRTYRYSVLQTPVRQPLLRHMTWQIHQSLDWDIMQKVAALLIGRHDFAAFGNSPQGENTVRDVFRSEWERHIQGADAILYIYVVEANAFLNHMVRRMVGMQVDAGAGRLTPDVFWQIFARADLSQAKTLAPPQGLVFANVRYDDKIDA